MGESPSPPSIISSPTLRPGVIARWWSCRAVGADRLRGWIYGCVKGWRCSQTFRFCWRRTCGKVKYLMRLFRVLMGFATKFVWKANLHGYHLKVQRSNAQGAKFYHVDSLAELLHVASESEDAPITSTVHIRSTCHPWLYFDPSCLQAWLLCAVVSLRAISFHNIISVH